MRQKVCAGYKRPMAGQTMSPAIFGYAPGMRRVQKFNWPPWLILGLAQRSRQENRSKELKGCAGQYAPEGIRWIQKVNGSPNDVCCHIWVCAGDALGTKNPPTLLILGLAQRSRQRIQASLQNVRIINLGVCAGVCAI